MGKKKNAIQKIFMAIIVSLILGIIPATQAYGASFKNCAELRKTFKYGVALASGSVNKGTGPIFNPRVNAAVFKSNRKLDTDRDNILCEVVRPKTVTTPTNSASQPSELVERCKIQEASESRGMTGAGFPEWDSLTPRFGKVKWAMIPIDFADLPGEKNFRPRVDDQMNLLSEWFDSASGGRFTVEWVVLDRWATIPGKAKDYEIPRSVNVSDAANGAKLFKAAMSAADPIFDFSKIQTVNFILPSGQTVVGESSQGFPWDSAVREYSSEEGRISSYSIPGKFFDAPGRTYWSYWAHEFGHAIGLPHIGSSRAYGDMQAWDLMGSQDGPSRELSGWLRFLAGWLAPEQVYCRSADTVSNLELNLAPLSSAEKGFKLVVIPVSKTQALVVESRRETKFSCPLNPSSNGVLVYTYDATLGHGENFLQPLAPTQRSELNNDCGAPPSKDFLLRSGDRVVFQGLAVEVLSLGSQDKLRVTRR
jgi:M6 family metalloprotease-like protein